MLNDTASMLYGFLSPSVLARVFQFYCHVGTTSENSEVLQGTRGLSQLISVRLVYSVQDIPAYTVSDTTM